MRNLKIEINLNDIVEDMFCDAEYDELGATPSQSFSEAVRGDVISSVSKALINQASDTSKHQAAKVAVEVAEKFINSELDGIILRKLRVGELRLSHGGFKSFDDLIESRISRFDIDKMITRHIDLNTKKFAEEMRLRYDNIFAAKVVQGLAKQKMLDPNVAEMLLGGD